MIQPRNNFNQSDEFEKAFFNIGDDETLTFNGYTCGQYWNGWECPYFEKEVTEEIISKLLREGSCDKGGYDEDKDEFYFLFEEEDDEQMDYYKGIDIVIDGEVKHVYSLGAFSWCWERV